MNNVETLTMTAQEGKFVLPQETADWVLAREGGYSPVQMLVSAIGACGGYVYTSVLEKSKVPAQVHKVDVAYARDENRQAQPLASVSLTFYVTVAPELHERAERCLKLVSPHCPVIQSIAADVEVKEQVIFI